MDTPENGDNDFARRLREYQRSLEEEWESSNPSEDDSTDEIARKARKLVINSIPKLIEKANLLALGADSPSVSLQAIKFLYAIVVPPHTVTPGTVDPMDELIKTLTKNEKDANPPDN